jgi:hypothetical protein
MSPTHTRRGQKLYRYYVGQSVIKGGRDTTTISRVPAADVERVIIDQLRVLLRSPEVVVATWRAARKDIDGFTEAEVREALERFDPLWDELFPAEQARIVHLLVERVDIGAGGASIVLRTAGLASLASVLRAAVERRAA